MFVVSIHPFVDGVRIPEDAKYLVLSFATNDRNQSNPIDYSFVQEKPKAGNFVSIQCSQLRAKFETYMPSQWENIQVRIIGNKSYGYIVMYNYVAATVGTDIQNALYLTEKWWAEGIRKVRRRIMSFRHVPKEKCPCFSKRTVWISSCTTQMSSYASLKTAMLQRKQEKDKFSEMLKTGTREENARHIFEDLVKTYEREITHVCNDEYARWAYSWVPTENTRFGYGSLFYETAMDYFLSKGWPESCVYITNFDITLFLSETDAYWYHNQR